ncbi:MAG: DUF177 domain-containing protein [Acidobacteria bacterium]|nr:DUF177 domain-containing protein [Acidobacteriota bacterium]
MSELLLDVSQMREAHARIERTYPPDALPSDGDVYRIAAPFVLRCTVHKDRQQFRLVGRVEATLELACSRCLERFSLAVDEAFDVLFLPHAEQAAALERQAGSERQVEDDDLSTAYYQDQVLDLGQLMQEQFYLVVPMKPLCGEDCRGLCSVCGTNLNTGRCECHPTWVDPRLAVLEQLKKDT